MIEFETKGVEEILSIFTEVTWDRYISEEEDLIVYGWIDREQDSYKDFVVVTIFPDHWHFVTSSSKYSALFSQRINGGELGEGHTDCERVEDQFKNVKAVKL